MPYYWGENRLSTPSTTRQGDLAGNLLDPCAAEKRNVTYLLSRSVTLHVSWYGAFLIQKTFSSS